MSASSPSELEHFPLGSVGSAEHLCCDSELPKHYLGPAPQTEHSGSGGHINHWDVTLKIYIILIFNALMAHCNPRRLVYVSASHQTAAVLSDWRSLRVVAAQVEIESKT
jgi:hypothetical protein